MTQEKLTLHRIWFMTNHEAEQAAERFRLLEGCIDVYADTDGVAVYTRRTVKRAMLRSLLDDYSYPLPPKYLRPSVIPFPDFLPGQLVRLLWYFPGAVAGHTVRVLHLSYSGNEYRYQVMDVETNAVGWIDAAGLEPLETTGETADDGGPERSHWCTGWYPKRDREEDEQSTEDSVGSRSTDE